MDGDKTYYPLTHPQKGIWYTEKLYPGTSIGIIAGTLKIRGNINYSILKKAIEIFVEKNDSLRLRFVEINGEPFQYISDSANFSIDYLDFSKDGLERLYEWDTITVQTPFDLIDSNLAYFAVMKTGANEGGFFIKMHHLISDAWTIVHAGNRVLEYYNRLINGIETDNINVYSYIDYIDSEKEYDESDKFIKDEGFWKKKLEGISEIAVLKSHKTNEVGTRAKRKTFAIPSRLSAQIREYSGKNRISVFVLFISALCMYISRITSKDDIIVGIPVLNRSNAREKQTLGMFISTVPLRVKVDNDMDFAAFSEYVSSEWMSILRHQKYPYDAILRTVRENNKNIDKLYDIVLSYQNARFEKSDEIEYREGRWHFNGHQLESLSVHINDRDDVGNIIADLDFQRDLFYAKEVEFIYDHVLRLLWHALDNPGRKLSKIDMISEREKKKILYEFNDTAADYPVHKCVHQLFEEQAKRTPENIALVYRDKVLSYGDLDKESNQMARVLRGKGVRPETIVGLMAHCSFEMIIGILGIMKAGGCYLPIDADYPPDRIKYMLDDSRADFLLTDTPISKDMAYTGEVIDLKGGAWLGMDASDVENANHPGNLIYIIYTSGSSGNPKGVMIEHRNVVRLLNNDKFQFSFDSGDVWTMFHSHCFDFSVWEMYGALLTGARLVIVPRETARDTRAFLDLMKSEKVTVLNQTPAAFYNLVNEECECPEKLLSLKYVIFGGEALKPAALKSFNERYPDTGLINMYGITETTVHVTFKEIGQEEIEKNISNIGKPIPTLKTYIVDKNLNLMPIGIPGELCVSGDGVGRGYLNNDRLTGEKFIPNPFVPGEVMYRSGDLARLFPRGDMEYLGRIDNQVKIRGYRVELGEIENALAKHVDIREALVIAKENQSGEKQLHAYYVSGKRFRNFELRSFLSNFLPEYMIPSYFFRLDKIPLNSNGKVDRKNLPDGYVFTEDKNFTPPQNSIQENLAKVWRDVLGLQRVGIDENFFELGGDSLSAVKVISRLGNGITYPDLYNNPTISRLAEIMNHKPDSEQLLVNMSQNTLNAESSIICFPYGGGGPMIYKELAGGFSGMNGNYSVYAVNLPQPYDGRKGEYSSINNIADELLSEIKLKIKGNIILYGHCVGSALAMATAKLLENENIPVKSIFLGGVLPPAHAGINERYSNPWNFVSDRNIINFLKITGLPELGLNADELDMMMKAFRRDARCFYKYFHDLHKTPGFSLKTTIHCVFGDKDLVTRNYAKKYKNWYNYSREVKLFVIEGGDHYFIKKQADKLAAILTSANAKVFEAI